MQKTQAEFEASITWSRVVAACIIRNEENEYLLVQEAQPKVYGLWNLPAGHVDKGEAIEAAAIREAKEETGLDVALIQEVGIWYRAVENPVCHAFTAEVVGGELTAQPGEILDAKWFSYDDIVTMHNTGELRVEWIFEAITRTQNSPQ